MEKQRRSTKGTTYGTRVIFTDELKKELQIDSCDHSLNWLARKYGINQRTVKKIIEECPIPPKVEAREKLDPLRRTELLAKDSASVLELTVHSMKTLLELEIKARKDDPTSKPTITVKDLKDFFETVAPYVLQKVESAPKVKGEKTPMAKVHNMFAKKTVS